MFKRKDNDIKTKVSIIQTILSCANCDKTIKKNS